MSFKNDEKYLEVIRELGETLILKNYKIRELTEKLEKIERKLKDETL